MSPPDKKKTTRIKASSPTKKDPKVQGEHIHPLSPELIAHYSPSSDIDSEKDIANYVAGQALDEDVLHVEKLKEEFVLGEKYEVWDVITDKNRWWVITNLTNLYSQKYFPSLDYSLSFHIGLMMRLRSRRDKDQSDEYDPFSEVFRRQEQSNSRAERAIEPEDHQAVGSSLRECLLNLMTVMRRRINLMPTPNDPKGADFITWFEKILDPLCPGGSNKQLRHYMKFLSTETWQLVNWLTHDRDANSVSSTISIHACDTLIGHSIQLLMREQTKNIVICPKCNSRSIRSHFDHLIEPDGNYYLTCGSCAWSSHPSKE